MRLTDEGNERRRVSEVGNDGASLCHSARDDSCRCGRKSPLKQPRRVAVASAVHEILRGQAVVGGAHKATWRISHRNAEANEPPEDGADGGVEDVLEEDVVGVLGRDGSNFKHGKASLHEKDEESADPDIVFLY